MKITLTRAPSSVMPGPFKGRAHYIYLMGRVIVSLSQWLGEFGETVRMISVLRFNGNVKMIKQKFVKSDSYLINRRAHGIVINRDDLIALLAATYDVPKDGLGIASLRVAQLNVQDALID